jgi:hypothetical protein
VVLSFSQGVANSALHHRVQPLVAASHIREPLATLQTPLTLTMQPVAEKELLYKTTKLC